MQIAISSLAGKFGIGRRAHFWPVCMHKMAEDKSTVLEETKKMFTSNKNISVYFDVGQ